MVSSRQADGREPRASNIVDARAAARTCVESILAVGEADGAVLYWWDEEQRTLVSLAYAGPIFGVKAPPIMHPGQGAVGVAYNQRHPILIDDYADSPYVTAWARDYWVESECAVPLIVRRRVLGVLSLMYRRPRVIDPSLQRMVELAAKQVAPTITVMGLLVEAEHSVSESVTLAKMIHDTATDVDISSTCARITETACRLVGADYGAIGVLEPDGTVIFHGVWGARVPKWRSARGQHLFAGLGEDRGRTVVITRLPERSDVLREEFANSCAEGARTVMVTPLEASSDRIGSLLVGWRVDVEPTLRQTILVETLAKHATGTIVHAREIQRIIDRHHHEHSREEHYRALADHALDLVIVFDANLVVHYASPSYRAVLGWEPRMMIGRGVLDFVLPVDLPMVERQLARARTANAEGIDTFCFRVQHSDGSTRILESRGVNRTGDPIISGWLLHSHDVTERKDLSDAPASFGGPLAKLVDRSMIEDVLHLVAMNGDEATSSMALIVVDLEHFGSVTRDLPNDVSDRLLHEVSDRLRSVLRGGDRIGRLGADEFVIVTLHADDIVVRECVNALIQVMQKRFDVEEKGRNFSVSVGVALYPMHGLDVETLLRHANTAARLAKRAHSGFAFYDMEGNRSAAARVLAVSALREAIAQDQLILQYQPIFDVSTQRVVQLEALCRWPSAPSGLKMPGAFIPLAEHTGLIAGLTDWVMRNAVAQLARWGATVPVGAALNISMENLSEPDLAERLKDMLARAGVDPSLICLELTESALLVDVERSARTLSDLVKLGVRFSIDDFGTGYTSLSYLNRFPVQELKIDRSFVSNLVEDERNRTIVRSIIELAHGLGLHVVAEGVEVPETLGLLREWGCDYAQGYLLAPALPAEQIVSRFFS
jgi:diguanylate cyclase (GGDEF)-like protein/PAS domain S-box-containing protein